MKSHCSDCGWDKVVAHTFMKGRNEVNLCAACLKSREGGAAIKPAAAAPKRAGLSRDEMTWMTLGILLGIAIGFNIAWFLWSLTVSP